MRYNLVKDLESMNRELSAIVSLRETIRTKGWGEVVDIFHRVIARYTQDVLDKCEKPEKHAIEIRCKKMVADSLGAILASLDSRVSSEDYWKQRMADTADRLEAMQNHKHHL